MGIGVLTGEIGCGKTITRTVIENVLDRNLYELVTLESSDLPFNHLLAEFINQIDYKGIEIARLSKFELLFHFKKCLKEKIINHGRHLVIFLDEAQQMEPMTLDELKNLSNISSEEENYLTIILVGQPELRDILKNMPQIDQRVSLRFHLNFLNAEEIRGYICHRLKSAGHVTGEVFTKEAIEFMYRDSKGIPREINRIAKLALDRAFSLQRRRIGKEIVAGIITDLHRQKGIGPKETQWKMISA
jgi:general secretion pathway protein A